MLRRGLIVMAAAAAGMLATFASAAVLPATEEQKARWAKPRPEPVTLELSGWTKLPETNADASFPNRHGISFQNGACTVSLVRNWDLSLDPGPPATIESEKPVMVDGRPTRLTTMSVAGSGRVQAVFLAGKGYEVEYQVGIRFKDCTEGDIDEVLRRVKVPWPLPSDSQPNNDARPPHG